MEMYILRFERMESLVSCALKLDGAEDEQENIAAAMAIEGGEPWLGWRKRWHAVEGMSFCQGLGIWSMYLYPVQGKSYINYIC
jgi:hypothetical protein